MPKKKNKNKKKKLKKPFSLFRAADDIKDRKSALDEAYGTIDRDMKKIDREQKRKRNKKKKKDY